MGFVKSAFGKGDEAKAGGQAAVVQQAGNQQAIAELKRQFGITQKNLQPFITAGTEAIPGVTAASTVGGLEANLADIFNTDIFGSLVGERGRAVQGQLAAGGLTRSGTALQEAARVPTDIGLGIEQLLSGRGANLAASGQSAAAGLGGFGAQTSGGIANLLSASGAAAGQGIITDAQAKTQGSQNFLNTAATLGAIFFSDPNLKENIEEISDMGELKLYQWDWIPEAKDTLIEKCMNIGFMADEVKAKFPEFVHEFCGFLVIDYPLLLEELEELNNGHI